MGGRMSNQLRVSEKELATLTESFKIQLGHMEEVFPEIVADLQDARQELKSIATEKLPLHIRAARRKELRRKYGWPSE